jgi:IS605 OrfB family transposase
MSKYIKYHNEDKDCASLPKYRKKKSLMPLITDQIRPIWYKGCKCIKLPLSNLARTSKIFNKVFEDELIDTFIKESELKKCFNIYIKIPKELYNSHIRQFRIIPNSCGTDYTVEFTYEVESFPKAKSDISKSMAIDLGISNLATCVTCDNESFIIDGKSLKSMNQFYNKQKAHFQSLLPDNIRYSKRLAKLDNKRNRCVEDYLNKAVSTLMTKIKELSVDEVIIGYNKNMKKGGIKNEHLKKKDKRRANQNFVSIPLSRFKDKLIFKCRQQGIKVISITEAYTSKASFYDNDKIEKGNYSGKRIYRGLYKRYNSNKLINADVNAALNIYKKYILKCNSTNNKIDYLMSRGLTIPSRILVNL